MIATLEVSVRLLCRYSIHLFDLLALYSVFIFPFIEPITLFIHNSSFKHALFFLPHTALANPFAYGVSVCNLTYKPKCVSGLKYPFKSNTAYEIGTADVLDRSDHGN